MKERNPAADPAAGDILYQAHGLREVHVDKVTSEEVVYRVVDEHGGLISLNEKPLAQWRKEIPKACNSYERLCPTCRGSGAVEIPIQRKVMDIGEDE